MLPMSGNPFPPTSTKGNTIKFTWPFIKYDTSLRALQNLSRFVLVPSLILYEWSVPVARITNNRSIYSMTSPVMILFECGVAGCQINANTCTSQPSTPSLIPAMVIRATSSFQQQKIRYIILNLAPRAKGCSGLVGNWPCNLGLVAIEENTFINFQLGTWLRDTGVRVILTPCGTSTPRSNA